MAVAGILASLRLSGKKSLAENKFVFLGAGEVSSNIQNDIILYNLKAAINITFTTCELFL